MRLKQRMLKRLDGGSTEPLPESVLRLSLPHLATGSSRVISSGRRRTTGWALDAGRLRLWQSPLADWLRSAESGQRSASHDGLPDESPLGFSVETCRRRAHRAEGGCCSCADWPGRLRPSSSLCPSLSPSLSPLLSPSPPGPLSVSHALSPSLSTSYDDSLASRILRSHRLAPLRLLLPAAALPGPQPPLLVSDSASCPPCRPRPTRVLRSCWSC